MDKVINVVGWVLFGVLCGVLGWFGRQLYGAYRSGDVIRQQKKTAKVAVETV